MSQPSESCYCQSLPTISKCTAGQPSKCPRCRGDLIVAWQTGIKYHLVASGGPGAHKLAWAMLGLVAALLGGVATAAILMRPQTLPRANVTAFGENGGPYESSSV